MAFAQDDRLMRTTPSPVSDLVVGEVYARSALASVQLARYIRALGYSARAHHIRNYGVLVVPVAVDAGLAVLGTRGLSLCHLLGGLPVEQASHAVPPLRGRDRHPRSSGPSVPGLDG